MPETKPNEPTVSTPEQAMRQLTAKAAAALDKLVAERDRLREENAVLHRERDEAVAACAAYRGFIETEMQWCGFRDEFGRDTASGKNYQKLQDWLVANKATDAGRKLLEELNGLRLALRNKTNPPPLLDPDASRLEEYEQLMEDHNQLGLKHDWVMDRLVELYQVAERTGSVTLKPTDDIFTKKSPETTKLLEERDRDKARLAAAENVCELFRKQQTVRQCPRVQAKGPTSGCPCRHCEAMRVLAAYDAAKDGGQ